jgi:hypothetical protein
MRRIRTLALAALLVLATIGAAAAPATVTAAVPNLICLGGTTICP